MAFLYVRGRNIRYVHLPGALDPVTHVDSHLKRIRNAVTSNRKAMVSQHQAKLPKGMQDEEVSS